MKKRGATRTGLAVYASLSLLVVGVSALVAAQPPRRALEANVQSDPRGEAISSANALPDSLWPPSPTLSALRDRSARPSGAALIERLVVLASREATDETQDEWARVEQEIVGLGEIAAPALVQRTEALRRAGVTTAHDRLLGVLQRLPGKAAEDALIREARSGRADSSRALAIESLGERRSERTVEALARIAETDPDLPARALITSPRGANEASTELPDEVVFTPRMHALAALATAGGERAAEVLTGVLKEGPDESLRMEAARHLATFRETPDAAAALRTAATRDPSPYVRLAALHTLAGSGDGGLGAMLREIAARDGDAGVRALAAQMLASLAP
ncbi:MAG TPA: HEAT repeat domain-containing protein [Polyangiaceae bacterium]|nr:HEAT repeat domain-containing protein [Polyangiaceae bacterium]